MSLRGHICNPVVSNSMEMATLVMGRCGHHAYTKTQCSPSNKIMHRHKGPCSDKLNLKIVACVGEASGLKKSASTTRQREFGPKLWNEDVVESLILSSQCSWKAGDQKTDEEKEKRIETLIGEIKCMFNLMGDGETSPSAYDTAWVARIPALDGSRRPQFPQTLNWVIENQLSDGSWGEQSFFLAYDRILSTLSCVITLTLWRTGHAQVQKGIEFIKKHAERMEEEADNHILNGFEIVFISMLNEAKKLGLDIPYEVAFVKQINEMRETKLKKISLNVIYAIPTTILYSLEGLQEIIDWKKIINLQSKDGSLLCSPASTAVVFMQTRDKKCLEFLNFLLKKFGDHVPCIYPVDLFERLWAVDIVERLGIDRHFQKEIKEALDYVYRYWNEKGIAWARECVVSDIDDTAMGLRILRLHGYDVSPDVLKNFRDENGEFFCFLGQTYRGVSDMLNVHRCSHVAFPGEDIMEEAKLCTQKYLNNALENVGAFDKWSIKKDIRGEVEMSLEFPWHRSLPRMETRTYIKQYGPNDVWLGKAMYLMPYVNNAKYLELAKLDFNSVQSIHQKEIRELYSWWKSLGFTNLSITPERVVEIYFAVSTSMFEPDLAMCRAVFTKTSIFAVVLSELFKAHGSVEYIALFSEAIKRWDLSVVDRMPEQMKVCFLGLYDTVNGIAKEAKKGQGRDVLPFLINLWEIQMTSQAKEAIWLQDKYVPSLDEYMENANVWMGLRTVVLTSALFTGEIPSDDVLSKIRHGKFLHLMAWTGRLVNDIKTYQEKKALAKASAVQSYKKEHPEISEKAALNHVHSLMQNALVELNWHLVNNKDVPDKCRKLIFNTARAMQLFYTESDEVTFPHLQKRELIYDCLFERV